MSGYASTPFVSLPFMNILIQLALELPFDEVEVALNAAEHSVVDHAFVAQAYNSASLHLQRFLQQQVVRTPVMLRRRCVTPIPKDLELPDAVLILGAQAFQSWLVCGVIEFVEPRQRGLIRFQARLAFFSLGFAAALDFKRADDRWKAQPLQHERDENHTEREKQDQVAC